MDGQVGKFDQVVSAAQTINKALETIPSSYLLPSIQRGLRLWPASGTARTPEFLNKVLRNILEEAMRVLQAKFGALGIGNLPGNAFSPWIFGGVPEDLAAKIGRSPRPIGVLGEVAVHNKIVRVKNIRDHPAFVGWPEGHPEVTSFIGIPIRYGSTALGNLYLGNKIGAPEFTEEDEKTAVLLAGYVAAALQQAYLHSALDIQHVQIQTILDSASSGIMFVSADGDVVSNPRASEMFNHALTTRADYIKQIFKPDGSPAEISDLPTSRSMNGETVKNVELMVRRPDGRMTPVMVGAAPVRDFQNRIIGSVVVFDDMSASKELEQIKRQFDAMVIHDLRGPLAAVLMQVDAINPGEESEGTVQVARADMLRIKRNAQCISRLIEDLIDITRIEFKTLKLERKKVDVYALVEDVVMSAREANPHRKIEFESGGMEHMCVLDPFRTGQILGNLIDNAVKNSEPAAPVRIRLECDDQSTKIFVEDQGVGISPQDLPFVFDRFFQSPKQKKPGGLGMGLYTSRHLAEAQGGSLSVESVVGKGSVFRLVLPANSRGGNGT